jgi:hypothetical protein
LENEQVASHGDDDETAVLLQNAYQMVWQAQGHQMAVEVLAGLEISLEISNDLAGLYEEKGW